MFALRNRLSAMGIAELRKATLQFIEEVQQEHDMDRSALRRRFHRADRREHAFPVGRNLKSGSAHVADHARLAPETRLLWCERIAVDLIVADHHSADGRDI